MVKFGADLLKHSMLSLVRVPSGLEAQTLLQPCTLLNLPLKFTNKLNLN